MGEFFHLYLIVCLCLTRRLVYSEETTTTTSNCNGSDCSLNGTTSSASTLPVTKAPTPIPTTLQNGLEKGRPRAMNYTFAFQDAKRNNGLETSSLMHKEHSIDDVSMEDMNDDVNLNYTNLMSNFHNMMNVVPMVKNTTVSSCIDNNKTYKVGEKFNRGCNESCQCVKAGEIMCGSICKQPHQVKGRNKDPSCIEVAVEGNSCCVLINCPSVQDLDAEPIESCYHKNETYKRGSTFNDTCDVCICEAGGRVNCKSRCPRLQNATGNCLAVQDPEDPCCKKILCDVEEHDVNKVGITAASDESGISSSTTDNQIISARPLNGTSVSLTFAEKSKDCNVEVSENGVDWKNTECVENTVGGLQPGKKYQIRLKNTASNKVEVTLPAPNRTASSMSCSYKGKTYKIGEEFHDGCDAYCICENSGVDCAPIECPTDFGLDVLDPHCLDWEMHPPDFTPTPPYCCPDKIRCKDNGSCTYNGENFPNWSELPAKATGCEKRCYCEMGNVTCSPMCPKISNTPPKDLLCPPEQAVLQKPPDDECCFHWTCPNVGRPDEVKIHILEAIDENTVKLVFSVPQVLVGLHGRVELRYTSDQQNMEPSTWEHQILAPPDDLIATAELEFELTGLQANTTYKIKISVVMSDVGNAPTSNILTIRTPAAASLPTTLPPIIPVEPDLRAIEVNATYVKVGWRMFSETELQFIDGVQLRYKELDDKIYAATPLIHRAVTTYTIEQLKPNSVYEIGIFFIPFPGQTTELQAQKTIQIRTGLEFDPYKFDILVEVHHIKASSIEISWSGVPYPEDKYVNIFRAIYQSDGSREDFSTFKVAKRDSSQNILIQDLKPGTRYRLWLEAYLTNGRSKKSNVKDFITKIGPAIPPSTSQGKLEGTPLVEANSYYGPLVAVSILATIAITSTIILILILAKKHGTIKAPITTPINRKNNSSAAYDNQAYKTYENDRNGSKAGSIALTVFPKTHVEKEA